MGSVAKPRCLYTQTTMDEPIALLDGLCDLNSNKRMVWYTNY